MTGRSDRDDRELEVTGTGGAGWTDADAPLVPPARPSTARTDDVLLEQSRSGMDRGAAGVQPEAPLFSSEEAEQLRTRWETVQASFVDEPRRAVEEADGLVRTVMERLTDGFTDQRERLEQEWGARDQVSTEDLRVALRHYRSFFDRLLKI